MRKLTNGDLAMTTYIYRVSLQGDLESVFICDISPHDKLELTANKGCSTLPDIANREMSGPSVEMLFTKSSVVDGVLNWDAHIRMLFITSDVNTTHLLIHDRCLDEADRRDEFGDNVGLRVATPLSRESQTKDTGAAILDSSIVSVVNSGKWLIVHG